MRLLPRRRPASRTSPVPPTDPAPAAPPAAPATPASGSAGSAGSAGGAAGAGSASGGALRAVLFEIRNARGGGVSLAEVAQRVGLSRQETEAMVDYWIRRGVLQTTDIGPGCSSGGCGSCPSGTAGATPGCGTGGAAGGSSGPVLVAITVRPRESA